MLDVYDWHDAANALEGVGGAFGDFFVFFAAAKQEKNTFFFLFNWLRLLAQCLVNKICELWTEWAWRQSNKPASTLIIGLRWIVIVKS